jgi:hypothetical protein
MRAMVLALGKPYVVLEPAQNGGLLLNSPLSWVKNLISLTFV